MNAKPQFSIGDRIPDFLRHDHQGQTFQIYKDACACPVVLLIVNEPGHESVDHELKRLAEIELPERTARLVMIDGNPEKAAQFSSRCEPSIRVIADDGAVMGFLLAGKPPGPWFGLVLDQAHRVIDRLNPGDQAFADRALATLRRHAMPQGQVVTDQAPVLVVPRVFEPAFCQHLIEVFETRGNEPSGVLTMVEGKMVYAADRESKIRREHRVEDPGIGGEITARLERHVLPQIQWAFNYQVTRYEGIKIVLYDSDDGGFFRPHRDNDGVDTAHRRFAMTLNLNSEDYQGGELRFPEFSNNLYKPTSGSAVIFSCSLAHEALPVTKGQRYALVSFFFSKEQQIRKITPEDRIKTQQRGWN